MNTAAIGDSIVTAAKIAKGQVVRSIHQLQDDVVISAGNNVNVTAQGNQLIISAGSDTSSWQSLGNNLFYNNGNVGIGTNNPVAQLDITGNFRLPETTAGGSAGVIGFGSNPVIHTFGTDNFFAGENAGNFSMNGGANVGLGRNTLLSNASGILNTAAGFDALRNNSSGSLNTEYNTVAGKSALTFNTSGNRNTAVGYQASFSNRTSSDNTAIGYLANVSADGLTNATAIGANAVVDASNKIRLGNNNVTLVETAGTISAAAFVGDGSRLTNLPNTGLALPFIGSGNAADTNAVFRITNTAGGRAISGINNSTSGSAYGVYGRSRSNGLSASAVFGEHTGTGPFGAGVTGSHAGGGIGVYGFAPTGRGMFGASNSGTGVSGHSSGVGTGAQGNSSSGTGVLATSNTGVALLARSEDTGDIFQAQTGTTEVFKINQNGRVLLTPSTGTGNAPALKIDNAAHVRALRSFKAETPTPCV